MFEKSKSICRELKMPSSILEIIGRTHMKDRGMECTNNAIVLNDHNCLSLWGPSCVGKIASIEIKELFHIYSQSWPKVFCFSFCNAISN